jgi:hypothetical protein
MNYENGSRKNSRIFTKIAKYQISTLLYFKFHCQDKPKIYKIKLYDFHRNHDLNAFDILY